jgi:ribonucleoside-diphosphate reductase beta chain
MTYSVFDPTNRRDHTKVRAFFDDAPTIARFDRVKWPWLEKLTNQQLSYFWRPEEVDLYRDSKDFKGLTPHEQHIFTRNIGRQILLDSVQGRAPVAAFGPVVSLPELETWIQTWTFSETIHSRSYTHIIRNVYADPSVVFDGLLDIREIVDCAGDITKLYDDLIKQNAYYVAYAKNEWTESDYKASKRLLWDTLMSVNVLEGVRFYVSFACSWAFAELKKMEGNAKIIKLIARDENLHLAGTQQLLKALPGDDPFFAELRDGSVKENTQLFTDAVNQEKAWAKHLFQGGSMIGLNEKILCDYIEWIADKRMKAVGLPSPYKVKENPLPWTQKWIAGSEVQVAPQEVEVSSYQIGAVKQDVTDDTFKGFTL